MELYNKTSGVKVSGLSDRLARFLLEHRPDVWATKAPAKKAKPGTSKGDTK